MKWVARGAHSFCSPLPSALTFLFDPWQDELVSDVPLYRAYSDVFLGGALPYRDVGFEYPPLAAPLIALPGLVSLDPETYRYAFAVLTFALAAGVLLATGRLAALGRGREWVALLVVALLRSHAGAMLRTHFDLAPVLCLVAGLAAVGAARPRIGFFLFGVGGALKIYSHSPPPPSRRRGSSGAGGRGQAAAGTGHNRGRGRPRRGRRRGGVPRRGAGRRSSTTSSAPCRSRACLPAC